MRSNRFLSFNYYYGKQRTSGTFMCIQLVIGIGRRLIGKPSARLHLFDCPRCHSILYVYLLYMRTHNIWIDDVPHTATSIVCNIFLLSASIFWAAEYSLFLSFVRSFVLLLSFLLRSYCTQSKRNGTRNGVCYVCQLVLWKTGQSMTPAGWLRDKSDNWPNHPLKRFPCEKLRLSYVRGRHSVGSETNEQTRKKKKEREFINIFFFLHVSVSDSNFTVMFSVHHFVMTNFRVHKLATKQQKRKSKKEKMKREKKMVCADANESCKQKLN